MRRLVIIPRASGFGDQPDLLPQLRRSKLDEGDAKFLTSIIDRITLDLGDGQPRQIVLDERNGDRVIRRPAVTELEDFFWQLGEDREIRPHVDINYEGRSRFVPMTPRAVAALNLAATIQAVTGIMTCPQCGALFTPGNRAEIAKFCSPTCKTAWNNKLKLAS